MIARDRQIGVCASVVAKGQGPRSKGWFFVLNASCLALRPGRGEFIFRCSHLIASLERRLGGQGRVGAITPACARLGLLFLLCLLRCFLFIAGFSAVLDFWQNLSNFSYVLLAPDSYSRAAQFGY